MICCVGLATSFVVRCDIGCFPHYRDDAISIILFKMIPSGRLSSLAIMFRFMFFFFRISIYLKGICKG